MRAILLPEYVATWKYIGDNLFSKRQRVCFIIICVSQKTPAQTNVGVRPRPNKHPSNVKLEIEKPELISKVYCLAICQRIAMQYCSWHGHLTVRRFYVQNCQPTGDFLRGVYMFLPCCRSHILWCDYIIYGHCLV